MTGNHQLSRFETNQGARMYRMPLNGFPGFTVYAHLVLVDDMVVLIDTGTNFHTSNTDLENGLLDVSEREAKAIGIQDLTHIFITHGHIDHIAGLSYLAPKTKALIAVHEHDSRILRGYQERKYIVSKRLRDFLLESGLSTEQVEPIMDMYMSTLALFDSSRVDLTYAVEAMQIGPFSFLNVPGHSSGAVVIRLHNFLFTGDHILSEITPHIAPERLTLNTGLAHYLASLAKLRTWVSDDVVAFGGHQDPITDLQGRIDAIAQEHLTRLKEVLKILEIPATVSSVSKQLFGTVHGYNVLLALEETGAHLEYLYLLGFIGIENLEEVNMSDEVIPIYYRSVRDAEDLDKVFPKMQRREE